MKRRVFVAIISFVLALAIALPILAIANPTSIIIHTGKVFQNIFETGDMLFVISYDIEYASEPPEEASDAFLINLVGTDNTTILLSRQINYYQYNVISIYATAAQALGLTWETEYKLRLTGNPALFGSITEGTNMYTKTLSITDYNTDGAKTSKELLQEYCIIIAEDLEDDWVISLLTTTTEGGQVLNSDGAVTFLDAIPSLSTALPGLFQLSSYIPEISSPVSTANYSGDSSIDYRLGTTLGASITGIGTFLGVGQHSAAGIWAVIFILMVASIIFLNSGNSVAALILATPVVVLMTYLGAIPEAITYILAILVVVYSMYYFWLRGT